MARAPGHLFQPQFPAAQQVLGQGHALSSRTGAVRLNEPHAFPIVQLTRSSSVREYVGAAIYPNCLRTVMELEHLSTVGRLVQAALGTTIIVPSLSLFHFEQPGWPRAASSWRGPAPGVPGSPLGPRAVVGGPGAACFVDETPALSGDGKRWQGRTFWLSGLTDPLMNNLGLNFSSVSSSPRASVDSRPRPPSLLEDHQSFYNQLNYLIGSPSTKLVGHWMGGINSADEGHLRDAIKKVWNLGSSDGDRLLNRYIEVFGEQLQGGSCEKRHTVRIQELLTSLMSVESLAKRVNVGGLNTVDVSPQIPNIEGQQLNRFQLAMNNAGGSLNVQMANVRVRQFQYSEDADGITRLNVVAGPLNGPQVPRTVPLNPNPQINVIEDPENSRVQASQINVSGLNASSNLLLGPRPLVILNDDNP